MIRGAVSGRKALVGLLLHGPHGTEREIEFLVDTGFVAYLSLPRVVVSSLGLPFDHDAVVQLADGSQMMVEAYLATIVWDDEEQQIEVLALDGELCLALP
jgi:clan AA aspartic protease